MSKRKIDGWTTLCDYTEELLFTLEMKLIGLPGVLYYSLPHLPLITGANKTTLTFTLLFSHSGFASARVRELQYG